MSSPIDPRNFEKLRRIAPNQLEARRDPTEWRSRALPEEIAFKLTNRCDLRCTHCYQWNDDGYHRRLPSAVRTGDLPLPVISRVLSATRELRSNVFVWGGEPLVYRDWDGFVDLMAADQRWTSICTNGTLIDLRMESLVRLSPHLELSISIDGFEAEHNALRGPGAFARTMAGLRSLVGRRRSGDFRGEVTVNCVISDALVPRLFEFVGFLETEGVETIYLSFPWHISNRTAALMDGYVAAHFPRMAVSDHPSWYSYTFRLDPNRLDDLRAVLARLDSAPWRVKLRYNPALTSAELREFVLGSDRPAQNKTRCLALRTRLDVFPNGDVVSCKFFPEFALGNLEDATLSEIWHGEPYNLVRETVARCGLMPVCAKCNLLYTRGA
jgi:radical SAM protein with 4Fe4S-binding SPASM domain